MSVDDPLLNTTSYPSGLDGLEYFVNGADITGDLSVNLNDVSDFSIFYFGEGYDYAADFLWDGVINLSDVAKLSPSYGEQCPVPTKAVVSGDGSGRSRSGGTVGVVFDAASNSTGRGLSGSLPSLLKIHSYITPIPFRKFISMLVGIKFLN